MKHPIHDRAQMERTLRSTSPEGVKALSDSLIDPTRGPHRAAATLALDEKAPENDRNRAREVLVRAGALAIAPTLELPSVPAASRLFAMRVMVAASLGLKQRVQKRLEDALSDRELVPLGQRPKTEEAPKPKRICDVASLELRKVVHHGEDPSAQNRDERAYLRLPFQERDAVLADLRARGEVRWSPEDGGEE